MAHLIAPILELLSRSLGMPKGAELAWGVVIWLAAFVVYAIRGRRRHGTVLMLFFAIGATALMVCLFSEDRRVSRIGLLIVMICGVGALIWDVIVRPRLRERTR